MVCNLGKAALAELQRRARLPATQPLGSLRTEGRGFVN
jgi:hypothetical protein